MAMGQQAHCGLQWSTDAPYREFCKQSMIQGARGPGCRYGDFGDVCVGDFPPVKVCNILVISDCVWQNWEPAARTPELRSATEKAGDIVLHILQNSEFYSSLLS